MNLSFGTFFWLSIIYMYMKYSITLPIYMDGLFLCVVILFMYFINVNLMQTMCGTSNGGAMKATLFPWLGLFGPMLLALYMFPEWKKPFSNTFGYIVAKLAGGNAALLALLTPGQESTLHYVYNDPSLMLNQFTPTTFDTVLASFDNITNVTQESKDAFFKIVKLKDIVSEWIWYMLTASIAISTSSSVLANSECTKDENEYVLSRNIAMANTIEPKQIPKMYTITE